MIKLQFRVSEAEEKAIRSAAEREGLSLSEYIRRAVLEAREAADLAAISAKISEVSAQAAELNAWQRVNVSILRRLYLGVDPAAGQEIEEILRRAGIKI